MYTTIASILVAIEEVLCDMPPLRHNPRTIYDTLDLHVEVKIYEDKIGDDNLERLSRSMSIPVSEPYLGIEPSKIRPSVLQTSLTSSSTGSTT